MSKKDSEKTSGLSFLDLYEKQKGNQVKMLRSGIYESFVADDIKSLPSDQVKIFSYHVQQLMSEIGEILSSDKRWKCSRKDWYDENNKKEEIADCFIELINIAMFSGFDAKEIEEAIVNKMEVVSCRIVK